MKQRMGSEKEADGWWGEEESYHGRLAMWWSNRHRKHGLCINFFSCEAWDSQYLPHLQDSVCAFAEDTFCASSWKLCPQWDCVSLLCATYDDILPFSTYTLHPQTEEILYPKAVEKFYSYSQETTQDPRIIHSQFTEEPTDNSLQKIGNRIWYITYQFPNFQNISLGPLSAFYWLKDCFSIIKSLLPLWQKV